MVNMRRTCSIAYIFLMWMPPIILSMESPSKAYGYEISFEDCEFVATSNVIPEYLPFISGGQESVMARIRFEGGLPLIRVECKPARINQSALTKANIFAMLKEQADSAALEQVQMFFEKSGALGIVGTYTGRKRTGDVVLLQLGKMYFGERSIFSVVAWEQSKNFPSKELTEFVSNIRIR